MAAGDDVGDQLRANGWRQGSLFEAPAARFAYHQLDDSGQDLRLYWDDPHDAAPFVVASQDCDIVAPIRGEPCVEALVCMVETDAGRIPTLRRSARFHVVNSESGLVAHAAKRVHFAKSALLSVRPKPWPGAPGSLLRFQAWLGRRYDRPAAPDAFNRLVQNPILRVLDGWRKRRPDDFIAFNDVVREFRVQLPGPDEELPWRVPVVLVLREADLMPREQQALDSIVGEMYAAIVSNDVALLPARIGTDCTLSMRDYASTTPIYLEHYSRAGDESIGAEPLPRA